MEAMRPAEVVRRLYTTFDTGDLDSMIEAIHPDAEVEAYAAGRTVLYGRAEVRAAFARAGETAYRVVFDVLEDLDDVTALAAGSVRFTPPDGAGFVMSRSAWLWTLRDGLAWRCEVFTDVAAARSAWARRTGAAAP
jgi:ketosteroid isomerase-like protein